MKGVFHDGIEEDADLKIYVDCSGYVDAKIFYNYLRNVLISTIEDTGEQMKSPMHL
jgi:hypothetical protein